MTDPVDLGCGEYVVGRSGEKWAVCNYVCRSERQGVVCGQKEVNKYVRPVMVAGGDGGVRSG